MNYMTGHLLDAIKLNLKRLPRYASLSKGRSLPVSVLMIFSELISLPTALALDYRSRYWRNRGVPVFVHEFVDMELTPKFKDSFTVKFPAKKRGSFVLPKNEMIRFIKEGQRQELSALLAGLIQELEEAQAFNCMLRHTLESFLRCSNLASLHIEAAAAKGIKTPERFCADVLFAHLMALDFCRFLDWLARPVQQRGIPIILQDVPPIPSSPESY